MLGQPIGYYCNNAVPAVVELEQFCGSYFENLNRPEKLYIASQLAANSNYSDEDEIVRSEVEGLVENLLHAANLETFIGLAIAALENTETNAGITVGPKPIHHYFDYNDVLTETLILHWGEYLQDAPIPVMAEILSTLVCAVGVDFEYCDEQESIQLSEDILGLEVSELVPTLKGLVYVFFEEQPLTDFVQNEWSQTAIQYYGSNVECALDDLAYWIKNGCDALIGLYKFSEEEANATSEIRDIVYNGEYDSYDCFNLAKGIVDLMHEKYFTQLKDAA